MKCSFCGRENRAIANFCGYCGDSLRAGTVCPSCNAINPSEHLFCDLCGSELKKTAVQDSKLASPLGTLKNLNFPVRLRSTAWTKAIPLPSSGRVLATLLLTGAIVAALGQLSLLSAEPGDVVRVFGMAVLAIGAILFALGSLKPVAFNKNRGLSSTIGAPKEAFTRIVTLPSLAFGILTTLLLLYRLNQGSTSGWDLVLWAAGIIGFAVFFFPHGRLPQLDALRRFRADILVVVVLVGIFIALNVHDLGDWRYSAIGDEYAFYLDAKGILDDGITKPFSQDGVYGMHPVLSSIYQAFVMAVFGQDNFGWRLASVLSVAVAIPGIYLLGMTLGNRKVAVISTTLFAFSHYLFAYAHTGYNNIHPLAPTVWALAFLALAIRDRNLLFFYFAGAIAGLGFYTHFSARAAVVIMFLFLLTHPRLLRHPLQYWPVALGFVVAAMPMFAVNRGDVLGKMLGEVAGGYSEAVTGPVAERILTNASKNLMAFNYNPDAFHYVSGQLLDPLTATLAILGIGLALARLYHAPYRLLILWTLVAVVATGILSPYPQVAISRLNFVVPPLTLLAGFAAANLWEKLIQPGSLLSRGLNGVSLAGALALLVLALNVNQFWFDTPEVLHLTQEAVAIGAMRSEICGGDPGEIIIVGKETEPLLKPALNSYYLGGRLPVLIDHDELDLDQPLPVGTAQCVIFINPNEETAHLALEKLGRRFASGQVTSFSDRAGKGTVEIFRINPG